MNKVILISFAMLILSGCSSAKRDDPVFPEPDITTKEIYEQNTGGGDVSENMVLKRPATEAESNIDPYMLHNTPRTHFRMLDNPTMYLFVNTHLSTQYRVPVPAYITEFKLLNRDEYALPSESNLTNWK
ncbi:hypothetical protein HC723_11755 [Vibrio sp. S11_S32]|uniref:hypothetical protein n=1 Tax=Vibrio sp. S11_S32 TaxID=2720225 RepID=UPI001681839E|nr:hypothetical protein [Vibrio sp. S11_S32]MBD1577107.1 hypothetical protein [Vibrio sp. S11_S32]